MTRRHLSQIRRYAAKTRGFAEQLSIEADRALRGGAPIESVAIMNQASRKLELAARACFSLTNLETPAASTATH